MPSYIPRAKYPKDLKSFNIIKMYPEVFADIELQDFISKIGSKRFGDFTETGFFLFSSQYQENDGAKLVMLLSSIERIMGKWTSLESKLRESEFRKAVKKASSGLEAWKLVSQAISSYNSEHGSASRIVLFYQKYTSKANKLRLARSIKCVHRYKKQRVKDGTLLITPVYKNTGILDTEEKINNALSALLKKLIYHIRSKFVHEANYTPFPNKKYLKKKKLFLYDRLINGFPKEQWVITMPFENYHKITKDAFINYWRRELLSRQASSE